MACRKDIVQQLVLTSLRAAEQQAEALQANENELLSAYLTVALVGILAARHLGADPATLHPAVLTLWQACGEAADTPPSIDLPPDSSIN